MGSSRGARRSYRPRAALEKNEFIAAEVPTAPADDGYRQCVDAATQRSPTRSRPAAEP